MHKTIFYLLLLLLFGSCQSDTNTEQTAAPAIREIASPSQHGAQGRLFTSAAGQVYFTWVEYLNDTTDALLFARLENGMWSTPKEIARGTNWFVNWADFPSLVASIGDDKLLTAHWLQMRDEGTYDYDVHLSQSSDGGNSWSTSFIPHRDSIAAEHGFVSMQPLADQLTFLTWLDGRNTKGEEHEAATDEHGHGHGGAMTIRAAIVDQQGQLSGEAELDDRVCDCCQTSAAITPDGPIVAYRDRSEEELRDIYIVRQVDGDWQPPVAVHNDQWKIAGCPVNGPVIKARGDQVAVAWFTAPEGKGMVKLAFSEDRGASFGQPIRIDNGLPMGRVGLEFPKENEVLVTWLEQADSTAEIRLAKVSNTGGKGEEIRLAEVAASRQSGFPVITVLEDELYFAYTQVDSLTRVVTGVVNW